MTALLPAALQIRAVSKRFGRTQALNNVSFNVERGSIHALLGGNGSGKSTLIKILAGVHSADSGTVTVAGDTVDTSHLNPHWARSAGLRFVHQDLGVFLKLTVAENICLDNGFDKRARCAISWREVERRTTALLEEWQIPARASDVLSGLRPADRTMIAIARAFTTGDDQHPSSEDGSQPLTLILDEPTSALPETEVQRLLDWLRQSSRKGNTVVLVTHRLEEVLDVATAVTALRDGRHEATRAVTGLTRGDLVRLIAPTAQGGPATAAPLPHDVAGHKTTFKAEPLDVPTQPRLKVTGLSGGSLRNVHFELAAGEIVGIAGLLGSGRTRLLHYLAGVLKPHAGQMFLDGEMFDPRPERRAIAAGVVLVPESRADDGIFPGLSISENIQAAALAVHRPTALALTPHVRLAAKRNVARFGIKMSSVDDDILTLSGGNQQKVLVGRWLATAPHVVLLDEPSVGVDVDARASLHRLVRAATATGAGVLCVSSDLYELVELSDRILVLREGTIAETLSGARLTVTAVGHAMHGSLEEH